MNKVILWLIILLIVFLIILFMNKTPFQSQLREVTEHSIKLDMKPNKLLNQYNDLHQNRPQAKYTSEEFQAGMNVLIYGEVDQAAVKQLFEHLQGLGMNSLAIVFPFYQDDWSSNEVKAHPLYTPSMSDLEFVIQLAHDYQFSIMIRPILDEESLIQDQRWRGQLQPTHPELWFNHYYLFLKPYVELAQRLKVDRFNIGTEFNSLEETYDQKWVTLIRNLREIYDGELVYSFNWDKVQALNQLGFIDELDYIGIDAYFPLDVPDHADVTLLIKKWQEWLNQVKDDLKDKPIIVSEVGTLPVTGSYRTPYAWEYVGRPYDREAQVQYYDASFQVWMPLSEGIYWWCVTLDDEGSINYSPLYSATEEVIKAYFLK